MKRKILSASLSFAMLVAGVSAIAQTDTNQSQSETNQSLGKVVVSETASAEATIQKIDHKNRVVTLKGPEGNIVKVKVGEEMQNFDQLKKGDQVKVDYYKSTALSLRKPGEPATDGTERQILAEPAQGKQGPSKLMVDTTQLTATISDIDHNKRTVTLKGPEGNTVQLKADERVKNFDQLKVGDQIVATFTDAVGISVVRE